LIGSQLGAAGINIINFSLGAKGDGQAVAAITVDNAVSESQLVTLRAQPAIVSLEMI
jgi:D-3-phosphoglycerate dehydrogenase